MLIDRSNRPNGVFPDVGVSMFEARPGRGKEGLDEFGFAQLAEKAERVPSNVLVWML